ncbi:MAG: sulfatase-like hydrolase/transferase [Polyangiaceae bacterium]
MSACHSSSNGGVNPAASGVATTSSSAGIAATIAPLASIDPIASLDNCIVGHEGALLDLGEKSARALYLHAKSGDIESIEREGATFDRIRSRSVTLSYFGGSEADEDGATYVTARIRGGSAKTASVSVNGKPAGVWQLTRDDVTIVTARAGQKLLAGGDNEIAIRFAGAPKTSGGEPLAEIDWIHVGAGDVDASYAAPTKGDITSHANVGGVSKEAIALRSPGFLRCIGWLPKNGSVSFSGAVSGDGDVDVEARILRDRGPMQVLQKLTLKSGQPWQDSTLPIGDDASEADGTLGAIEFAVTRSSKDARFLLGAPKVVQEAPPPQPPAPAPARSVIVVVLGDVSLRALSIYGGQTNLDSLGKLVAHGIVFDQHRSGTTFPSGALASMLSGQSAHAIKMDLPDARLPKSVVTIADAARQAGVVTGFFTANPTTAEPFGFDRSWQTMIAHGPDETPATNVFDDAANWIDTHKSERFLAVIHARGGHPPWDVSPEELKNLPPASYMGALDPRHAGELLARARHIPPALHLTDADRERMWALYASALTSSDAALGKLLESLTRAGRDDDTMIIVTSDVPVDESARVSFGEGGPPEEIALLVPLIVRPAGHDPAQLRVHHRTADLDVAKTVLDALGLTPPPDFRGIDLLTTATLGTPANGRPLLATARDRYAIAWGDFILAGSPRHELVCVASLDPACALDTRSTHPIAAHALDAMVAGILATSDGSAIVSEPVRPDVLASPAMRSWGRTQ